MAKINFTTAVFDDGDGPMWAVLPDDLTTGFIIGEWPEVEAFCEAIYRLVVTHQADEEISSLDERLGTKWLTVSEAAEQWGVSVDTVRWAARNERIKDADKQRGRWRFPQRTFLHWLNRVHRPKKK
jgi:excisionase family DNA binding protein